MRCIANSMKHCEECHIKKECLREVEDGTI